MPNLSKYKHSRALATLFAAFFCAFSVFACRPQGGGAPDAGVVSDASDGLPGPWHPPLGPGKTSEPDQNRFGSFVVASPAVLVNSTSLGAWTATTNGINVAAGETVSVKLADSAGARLWQLSVVGTDELVAAPTITQAVSVSGTATFVAPSTPATGWALIVRSQIGYTALGNDSTGRNNTAYVTTFGLYLPTSNSYRVGAVNETVEGSSAFGWAAKFNPLLRATIATGSAVGTDRAVNSTGLIQGGGNLSTDRTLSLVAGTNNYVIQTIAGVPTWQLVGNANIATGAAIDVAKLGQGAATTGQAIVWNGSTWAAGTATSANCGVATLAALRAVVSASRVDGQQCSVITPTGAWVYSNTSGAGFADDAATVLRPDDVLLAANGRWYNASPGPVVPTIAALRFAVAGKHPTVHVQAYSSLADGGGGDFEYDSTDTTTADNTGTVVVAGTRRYKRRYSGAVHGEWWGVKANALQITDGVRTNANARLVSASGLFTPAMQGRAVLIRERDNTSVGAGTISIPGGGSFTATGTGTNFAVAFPKITDETNPIYQPASGGAIWVNGAYYAVNYVDPAASPNQLLTLFQASPTQSAKAFYTETQRITTVATYVSATEITLAVTAPIDESGVWATIATDDTTAIDTAVDTALALGAHELVMPTGLSGISSNLGFTNASDLTIRWERGGGLVDLRKISTEYAYPNAAAYYGALSFVTSSNIHLVGGTYDANVPVLGVVRSAGGSVNNSGSRSGIVMSSCVSCSVEDFSSTGYGARDEHIYAQGVSPNFLMDRCTVLGNNNVALNFNGSGTGDDDVRITNSWASSILLASASFVVDNNHITTNGHARNTGGITVGNVGHGVISNNILHDINMLTAGTSLIDVYGGNNADSSLSIRGNKLVKNNGLWDSGHGAPIKINNHGGTVTIDDNVIDKNTAYPSAGRFINILGASLGKVHVTGTNVLRGRAGSLMTIGVEVESGVPSGAVTIDDGIVYGESITTRHVLGNTAGRARLDDALTVSATGTTVLAAATDTVLVTANGSVTLTLYDPAKVAGHHIVIKNSTSQAGTTTIGTAAGNIDGSSTTSLAGANLAAELFSDGTNWKLLSGSSVAGGVPTTRTITATAPITIDGTTSADFSANRTLAWNAGGTSNRVALTTNGTTMTMGQVDLATSQVTGALPNANQGAQTLAGDVTGTTAASIVAQLTGVTNSVAIPAATHLDWASSGPSLINSANDLHLKVNTTNSSVKILDGSNTIGFFNWNSGTPYFQQLSGAGMQFISTGGPMSIQSASSNSILFKPGGSTTKVTLSSTELTLDESFFTFGTAVSSPLISQANPASGNGAIMGIQAQNGFASGNTNGGDLQLKAGVKNGSGTNGVVSLNAGATPIVEVKSNGVDLYSPFLTFQGTATNPVIGHLVSTGNSGGIMAINAQDGNGTNKNGGLVKMVGGTPTGVGLAGSAALWSGSSGVSVEATSVNNDTLHHVVALAGNNSLTGTQMPTNTGDRVVFIWEKGTNPTANPVGGGILYVDGGALKYRGTSGTVTTVGPA